MSGAQAQQAKNLLPAGFTEASTVTLIGWYRVTGKAVQRAGTVGQLLTWLSTYEASNSKSPGSDTDRAIPDRTFGAR